MRVEIAACLLTISLALLVPESLWPPLANPLKRAAPARSALIGAEPSANARALRESLTQGGEAERVDFNKRNETDRNPRDEKNEARSAIDFQRLQNIW